MSTKIISIQQAIEMKNEYKSRIKPLIESNKGSGYKATEYAWIDIDSLKNYVALLEEVSKKNGTSISGIRVYFSAYPESGALDPDYAGRETIFMVPTVEVPSTTLSTAHPNLKHLPFCINPSDKLDKHAGAIEIIDGLLHSNDNAVAHKTTDYNNKTSLVLNEMSLTPPPG